MKNTLQFNTTNVDYPNSIKANEANNEITISIHGNAFAYLSEIKEKNGWLNSVKVKLTKETGGSFEGDIRLLNVEFNLSKRTAICKVTELKPIN